MDFLELPIIKTLENLKGCSVRNAPWSERSLLYRYCTVENLKALNGYPVRNDHGTNVDFLQLLTMETLKAFNG